jgi:hypothetical protein
MMTTRQLNLYALLQNGTRRLSVIQTSAGLLQQLRTG